MSHMLSFPNGRIFLKSPAPPEDDEATHRIYTHPLVLEQLPMWNPRATVDDVRERRTSQTAFETFAFTRLIPLGRAGS